MLLDMQEQAVLRTSDVPELAAKMESALPGIFPDEESPFVHTCGGQNTGIAEHPLREEIQRGTTIPHLLEHVLLHLLSRRSKRCSAKCGQRAVDLNSGLTTHYYLAVDCPSEIEAVVAIDIAFKLVDEWLAGRCPTIDADSVVSGITSAIAPMLARTT